MKLLKGTNQTNKPENPKQLARKASCSFIETMMVTVRNISLINLDVNLSAVPSLPPSYQFVPAAGQLKKSLVTLTTAEISVSSYILLILTLKHS